MQAEGDMLTPPLLLVLLLPASHARVCPPCGKTAVPYPLSTGDGCGDPAYKVRCARSGNSSTLVFDALNGASYPITSVTPAAQRLVVSPAPFVPRGSCVSEGAAAGRGVQLSASLPFNVSSSNTIMLLNCTRDLQLSPLDCSSNSLCHAYADLLLSPLDCSSDSLCHAYANTTGSTASACAPLPLCCTFVAGGSSTSCIPVSPRFCSAYRSFVGLDPTTQPPQTWGSRLGLELQWATPREPLCRTQADCEDGAKATCRDDPLDTASGGAGKVRRCFCIRALTWNPLAGACQLNRDSGGCLGSNIVAAAIAVLVCIYGFVLLAAPVALFVHCRRQRRIRLARERLAKEPEEILNANSTSGPIEQQLA